VDEEGSCGTKHLITEKHDRKGEIEVRCGRCNGTEKIHKGPSDLSRTVTFINTGRF